MVVDDDSKETNVSPTAASTLPTSLLTDSSEDTNAHEVVSEDAGSEELATLFNVTRNAFSRRLRQRARSQRRRNDKHSQSDKEP